MLSKTQRHDAIWDACVANQVPHLAFGIQIYFTQRLTRSYGSFYYKERKIYLSKLLFNSIPHIKQYECLVHLACHMIVRYQWTQQTTCGSLPRAHGAQWKAAMRRANVPATSAYCYVPVVEKPTMQRFGCACHQNLRFHSAMAVRLQEVPYDCVQCDSHMQPIGA